MAYSKKKPSVFVICSPFQALCAIAAMSQLEISDYLVFVRLRKGEVRNEQTISILNYYGINYHSFGWISSKSFKFWFYVIKALFHQNNEYKRLFIGDYRDLYFLYVGCGYVSDSAQIVYLDDGLSTVPLLKGYTNMEAKGHHRILTAYLSKRRNFVTGKYWLTIFGDIKNDQYDIKQLDLHRVLSLHLKCNENNKKNIYILGTVVDHFCAPHQISEAKFINLLEQQIKFIVAQNPNENVYYIPHGREKKKYAEKICADLGVIFFKTDKIVEMALVGSDFYPLKVYGFSSTALFTLKKIFPDADIIDLNIEVLKDSPHYDEYAETNNYYLKNGIILMNLSC